ncbi:MAG: ABC transporter ATP-binding protein [Verrucomicrobiota bacterium]
MAQGCSPGFVAPAAGQSAEGIGKIVDGRGVAVERACSSRSTWRVVKTTIPAVPSIVLEDVKKTFPAATGKSVAAVSNLSLTVADREWLTIVGPSGSGKTTLLRLIAGLEAPDAGRICFDGRNVTYESPQARDVAMVFQSHALFPHFTAFENIAFGLKLRGGAREQIAQRVHETAALLGVGHCLDRPPAKLSGGERQRIALGRALIRQPKILLLDEPFANLDEPMRVQMQAELAALRQRFAVTLIWVTHHQAEALAGGDRVVVMRKGELQQVGLPREVHDQPANHFVAGFIGSPAMNLFHGKVAQRAGHLVLLGLEGDSDELPPRFILPLGPWRADWFGAQVGRTILLGLRPTAIRVLVQSTEIHPGDLADATVMRNQFSGTQSSCTVMWQGREFTASVAPETTLIPGQKVVLRLELAKARVFDAATGVALF